MDNINSKKEYVKSIARSLRTKENQVFVNGLLGYIDVMTDEQFSSIFNSICQTCAEKSIDPKIIIKKELETKIQNMQNQGNRENYSLNGAFQCNRRGNSVLLHMPIKFTKPFGNTASFHEAMDAYNPYLLDAIDKLRKLKENGYHLLDGVDNIEMYSPILMKDELDWLKDLGFETNYHKKGNIKDPDYVKENPEAKIGIKQFGGRSFGTAKISFEKVNSKEFQEKKRQRQKEFEERGITLSDTGPMQEA